jgi:hypothetical protein
MQLSGLARVEKNEKNTAGMALMTFMSVVGHILKP